VRHFLVRDKIRIAYLGWTFMLEGPMGDEKNPFEAVQAMML